MDSSPFHGEGQHTRRKVPSEDPDWSDLHAGFQPAVMGVEVRWTVVVEVHLNDDTEEAGDLGHIHNVEIHAAETASFLLGPGWKAARRRLSNR